MPYKVISPLLGSTPPLKAPDWYTFWVPSSPPVVLTIAGFDPSSGAGVTADIKTIAAHGCYGVACITAITVQSTQGVKRVETVSARMITDTLEALASDMEIAAVHIGMLGDAQAVRAVVDFQRRTKLANLVLDPVLRSSSGTALIDDPGRQTLISELMLLADVITPNIDEAASITGEPVNNVAEMKAVAEKLHRMGAQALVITGGHLTPAVDLLSFFENGELAQEEFPGEHQESNSTHGTGCAFSTAMACNLARGMELRQSVKEAKAYVAAAILHGQQVGHGVGPVNHLFRLQEGK